MIVKVLITSVALIVAVMVNGYGQVSSVVRDSLTSLPVPFVNIWIADEMIGTTSSHQGAFTLNVPRSDKYVILSVVGYASKRIKLSDIGAVTLLQEQPIQLKEVVIQSKRTAEQSLTVGTFKKSTIYFFFSCGEVPWMIARHFPYTDSYADTPYLKKISVVTKSNINNAKFNIRLYRMSDGVPGSESIYNENVIALAKKGTRVTTVDLSEKLIEFPKEGIVITIEFLTIPLNRLERKPPSGVVDNLMRRISYEPSIGTIPFESGTNGWMYSRGYWNNVRRNPHVGHKDYRDKFSLPAITLELGN